MGYPSRTWLLRTLQNHFSWKLKLFFQKLLPFNKEIPEIQTLWPRYLKHKHLPSEDGNGVEVPVADVGSEARLVRRVSGLRVVVR